MSRSYRRRLCSPATAPPLEDENLLAEILLRLPPQPSSLPRASLVCKGWRRLVSDPAFSRRFRAHHRRNASIIGFFVEEIFRVSFIPALVSPNCISPGRFSLELLDDLSMVFGCRHGLFLFYKPSLLQVLVWDPVTGDQLHLAVPPAFGMGGTTVICNGAVLRAAGDVHDGSPLSSSSFQVVLVGTDGVHPRASASIYSSETGMWSGLISSPLPSVVRRNLVSFEDELPGVLIGDSLYWLLARPTNSCVILHVDLGRQSLGVIEVPDCAQDASRGISRFRVVPADGGGLGFLRLSDFYIQLWKRTDFDGVASWVLQKSIAVDDILASERRGLLLDILGFAEENNTVFLWSLVGVFTLQLESMQCNKLFGATPFTKIWFPFASVYAAAACECLGDCRKNNGK